MYFFQVAESPLHGIQSCAEGWTLNRFFLRRTGRRTKVPQETVPLLPLLPVRKFRSKLRVFLLLLVSSFQEMLIFCWYPWIEFPKCHLKISKFEWNHLWKPRTIIRSIGISCDSRSGEKKSKWANFGSLPSLWFRNDGHSQQQSMNLLASNRETLQSMLLVPKKIDLCNGN